MPPVIPFSMSRPSIPACWLLVLAPLAILAADNSTPTRIPIPASPVTNALRATLPTYNPSPAVPSLLAKSGPIAPVLMDQMTVTGAKLPTFGEWQLLTPAGQAAYLKKHYPGASVPSGDPMIQSVPNYAAAMVRDDTRRENLRQLHDTADLYRLSGDLKGAKQLKLETQRALLRRPDWRTDGLDRSYNNNRR